MKKIILTFIALLLAGVNTAWAQEETGKVRLYDSSGFVQGYSTLQAALYATNANTQTVKLFESTTETVNPCVYDNVTIDLNGCTVNLGSCYLALGNNATITDTSASQDGKITGNNENYSVNVSANSFTLTLTKGTIENTSTADNAHAIVSKGTVNLNGGTVTAAKCAVRAQDGSVKVDGCTINAGGYGIVVNNNSQLTFNSGSITAGGTAIATNGSDTGGAIIAINGGTISGTNAGIFQPIGTVSVTGGTISGATGIYQKSGTLNISGGTINGTGAATTYNYSGNGFTATGDGIVIDNCGYPGGTPTVSITGGNINSTNAQPVSSYVGNSVAEANKVVEFISGGTFSGAVPQEYLVDDMLLGQDSNGTYVVVNETNAVASIEDTKYATLAAAFAVVETGGTIKLLDNVTLPSALDLSLEGKTVTLDLNTKTLTGRTNLKSGNLTIKNGTVAGGAEQALNVYGSATTATNYSVLTINSDVTVTADVYGVCLFGPTYSSKPGYGAVINIAGTVTTTGDSKNGAVFVSGNLGNNISGDMNNVINITGKVTSSTDAAVALNGNATVNIKDGSEITGYTAIAVKRGVLNVEGGTIHATGAEINPPSQYNNGTEMTGAGISMTSSYNQYGDMAVNITGGTVTSDHSVALFKYEYTNRPYTNDATYAVSGGTFSSPVPEEFCAAGYLPVKTVGGFGVTQDDYVAEIGADKFVSLADAFGSVLEGDTIKLLKDVELTEDIECTLYNGNDSIYMQFGTYNVTKGNYSIKLNSAAANGARSAEPASVVGGVVVKTDKITDIFDAANEGEILLVGTTNDPNFPYYYQVVSETPDEAIAVNNQTGMLFSDLQVAVDLAQDGQIIELLPNIEKVTLTKTVNINKGIRINGNGYQVTNNLAKEAASLDEYVTESPVAFKISGDGNVSIDDLKLNVTFERTDDNEFEYKMGGIGIQVVDNYSGTLTVTHSEITTKSRGIDVQSVGSGFKLNVLHSKIFAGVGNVETEYIHTFDKDPYQRSRGINFGAVSGIEANIQFCEIAGFSYPVNAAKESSALVVDLVDCSSYGRCVVNNWGNTNKFNLSNYTAHAYNNQEEGDTETFAIVVDNDEKDENDVVVYRASHNMYTLNDMKGLANVLADDSSGQTDATQKFVDIRGEFATVKITGNSGLDIDEDSWDRVGFMNNELMLDLIDGTYKNMVYFDETAKKNFNFWFETIKPWQVDPTDDDSPLVRLAISDSIDHTNLYPVIAVYPKVMLTIKPEATIEDMDKSAKVFYYETLKDAFDSDYFESGAEITIMDNIELDEDITPNLQRGEEFTLISELEDDYETPKYHITPNNFHIYLNPLVIANHDYKVNPDSIFAATDEELTTILTRKTTDIVKETVYETDVNGNIVYGADGKPIVEDEIYHDVLRYVYTAANVYWSGDVNDIDPDLSFYWLFDELFTSDEMAPAIFSPGAYTRLEMNLKLNRDVKLPKIESAGEWEEEPIDDGTGGDGGARRMAEDIDGYQYWLDFKNFSIDKGEYSMILMPGDSVYTTALTDVFSSGDAAYYVTYDDVDSVKYNEEGDEVKFIYRYYLQKDGLAVTVDPATYCGDRLIPNFEVKKKVVVAGQETWVVLNGITSEEYDEKVAASEDLTGIDFTWHLVPPVSADDDSTYIDAKTYFQSIVIEGITFQGTRKADFTILPRDIKDVTASGNEQPWTENGYTPEQIKDLIKLIYYCNNHENPANPELVKDVDYRISVAGESAQSAINYTYPASTPYTYKGTFVQADATTVDYYITPANASVAKNLVGDMARFLGALYRASGVTSITYDGGTYSWSEVPDELKGSNWRDASNTTLVSVIAGQFSPTNMPESLTITTDKGKITVNIHVTNDSAPAPASTGMYLDVNTYPQVITITAIEGGNYTGTLKLDFTILPEDLIDISKCMVVSDATYTSDTLPPLKRRLKVILKDPATGTETVVDSAAYTLEVHGAPESYINAQTYSNAITIKGRSSYIPSDGSSTTPVKGYYGSLDADYVIKPRDLADSLDVIAEKDNQGKVTLEAYAGANKPATTPATIYLKWTGSELLPVINSNDANKNNINLILTAQKDTVAGQTTSDKVEYPLIASDYTYTIEPAPMVDPGIYKVIFTGRGNFTGMREVNVMVLKDINELADNIKMPYQIIPDNLALTPSQMKGIEVKDGNKVLVENEEYTLVIKGGKPGEIFDETTPIYVKGKYYAYFYGKEPYYTGQYVDDFRAFFEYIGWDTNPNDNSGTNIYNNPTSIAKKPDTNGNIIASSGLEYDSTNKTPVSVRITDVSDSLNLKAEITYIDNINKGTVTACDPTKEIVKVKPTFQIAAGKDNNEVRYFTFNIVGVQDNAFKNLPRIHCLDLTQIEGYTPDNLTRSEDGPFNYYPVQSLVYFDGTQGADITGTNYIYVKSETDETKNLCEELKIYDDIKGDQQGFETDADYVGGGHGWEFRNVYPFTAAKVTNTRYFTAGQHYTTCLPYKLQMNSALKAYTLDAASDNIFGFKQYTAKELDQFTPYVLIPSKGGNLLNNDESTVCYVTPTSNRGFLPLDERGNRRFDFATPTGHIMYGSNIYMGSSSTYPTVEGLYIMQSKNLWKRIPAGKTYNNACVLPMRGYIMLPNHPQISGGNPSRESSDGPEYISAKYMDVDGVAEISIDANDDWTNAEVYDLQGRKVDTTKTTMRKGVYIVNGQKRIRK